MKHVIRNCCWYLETPLPADDAFFGLPIMAKFDDDLYCQGEWILDEDGDVMFSFSETTDLEMSENVEAWCFLVDFE